MEQKEEIGEEKVNQNETSQENYEREDSETGFTQSSGETALLKASRKYDVIANKLFGNFDENGHYEIEKEILIELSQMKKLVGVKTESGLELKSFYKGITIEFLLQFNESEEDEQKTSATLFVMERISKVNGYIINTLITPVATYTYKNDEYFKDYCFRAFHIVLNIDDSSDGALDGDALNIDKRLAYLLAVREASRNAYIELEELYFNKRLAILDSFPEGAIILSEFAKKRAMLEPYFINSDRNKFRALNELLTSILEANPEIVAKMPALDVMMTPLNNKYLENTIAIGKKIKLSEKYKALAIAPVPLEEPRPIGGGGAIKIEKGGKSSQSPSKKPAKTASKPKSKSKGKSKSGGGGGKKKDAKKGDKKKDDKKKKKVVGAPSKPPAEVIVEGKKEVESEKTDSKPDIFEELEKEISTKKLGENILGKGEGTLTGAGEAVKENTNKEEKTEEAEGVLTGAGKAVEYSSKKEEKTGEAKGAVPKTAEKVLKGNNLGGGKKIVVKVTPTILNDAQGVVIKKNRLEKKEENNLKGKTDTLVPA